MKFIRASRAFKFSYAATTKSDAINVANFVADFDYPVKIYLNQNFTFTNKSTKLLRQGRVVDR